MQPAAAGHRFPGVKEKKKKKVRFSNLIIHDNHTDVSIKETDDILKLPS